MTGGIPESLCSLPSLVALSMESNSLTSLPACISELPLVALTIDRNQLSSLPSLGQLQSTIVWLSASSNQLTYFPSDASTLHELAVIDLHSNPNLVNISDTFFSAHMDQLYSISFAGCAIDTQFSDAAFSGMPGLSSLDLSSNSLSGGVPLAFRQLPNLQILSLGGNQMSGEIDSGALDGLASLQQVSLRRNAFSGPLPNFFNCTALTSLDLEDNWFSGGIPNSWAILPIAYLDLTSNQLTGPMDNLALMPALTQCLLGFNAISISNESNGDVGAMLFSITAATLLELQLQNNLLDGVWGVSWSSSTLLNLNLSSNRIGNLPSDLWTGALLSLDVSNNSLSGYVPTDINDIPGRLPVQALLLHGNPNLYVLPLPSWLAFASGIFTSLAQSPFECLGLFSPVFPNMQITLDPQSTGYIGCQCKNGTFGFSPNCVAVPALVELTPYGSGVELVSDDILVLTQNVTFDELLQDGGVNITTFNNSIPVGQLSPAFTDDWYGQRRQTIGLSTVWVVSLLSLRQDILTDIVTFDHAPVSASTIAADEQLQPTRVATLRLHISIEAFNQSIANSISVFDENDLGVASIAGRSLNSNCSDGSAFTNTLLYQQRYGSMIADLGSACLFEIIVFTSKLSLSFTSRDTDQRHFVATYSYDFKCPTDLPLDSSTNICGPPSPVSRISIVTEALAVSGAVVILAFCLVARERYRREVNKSKRLDGLGIDSDADFTQVKQAYDLAERSRRQWKLRVEIVETVISIGVDLTLTILMWVSSIALLSNSNITQLSVAYVGVTVISSMAFIVNLITRALSLHQLSSLVSFARPTDRRCA